MGRSRVLDPGLHFRNYAGLSEIAQKEDRCYGTGANEWKGHSLSFFASSFWSRFSISGFRTPCESRSCSCGSRRSRTLRTTSSVTRELEAGDSGPLTRKSGGGVRKGIEASASRFGGGPVGTRSLSSPFDGSFAGGSKEGTVISSRPADDGSEAGSSTTGSPEAGAKKECSGEVCAGRALYSDGPRDSSSLSMRRGSGVTCTAEDVTRAGSRNDTWASLAPPSSSRPGSGSECATGTISETGSAT